MVERSVDLDSPVEDVWAALTEPSRLSARVGGTVDELDVRPGGRGTVRRADGAVRRVMVEAVEPARRLALRWWPFEVAGPSGAGRGTRVEILLAPRERGTRLRVIEHPPLGPTTFDDREPRGPEPSFLTDATSDVRAAVG